MNIIEVKNLHKSYGQVKAVNGLSFEVKKGEIFGLLGPNGAGKTTTLEILEGLRTADSGKVKILGEDILNNSKHLRDKVGIVLQNTGMLPYLTLLELFEIFSSFYKSTEPIEELAQRFDLEKIIDRHYEDLSGGQKQRFVLALALLHKPEIVFLDEPTVGLDPQVRQNFWDIIMDLRRDGMTILLTTHYMDEAEILSDRVAIIDHGKIVAVDKPVKLVNSLGVVSHIKFVSSKPINVGDLEQLPGIIAARRDRYIYDLETSTPEQSLRVLLEWEKQFSGRVFNLQVQQATLEDVFLKLTGRTLRE